MHRRLVLAAGTIVLAAPSVLAQPAAPSNRTAAALGLAPIQATVPPMPGSPLEVKIQTIQPLRLEDAVAIALERSPQLELARLTAERAEATVLQAQAGLFPTVSLTTSYTYNQSATSKITAALLAQSSAGGLGSAVAQVETAPFNTQISVDWTIFSSGQVGSRIEAASESLRSARLGLERTRQDLLQSIVTAYYNLQTADGNVEIGEASVRSGEASLKDAQAQEKAGVGTRFAALQAQVQLANARQTLLSYQNQRIVAQRDLARLLNFPTPTDVTAADPIEKGNGWQASLEESILLAYRNRVELEQYLAQERSARATEAAYYAATAPQLSVFLSGQTYDNLLDTVRGIYSGYSAGAQIQWQIFDGGAAAAQAAQSVADAKTARINYIDTRNSIRYAVENAYASMLTASLQIDTATEAASEAEESLRLARLRFQAGVGTQLEVINADRDLAQARINRLTAVIDYNKALISLHRATGTL
jgi:OMF family outer membrane factor